MAEPRNESFDGKMTKKGRPIKEVTKVAISVRFSPDVLEYFRATGNGWQTRMDAALKEWIKGHRA
jgi:uncharacterized protein (DUF4415 family)